MRHRRRSQTTAAVSWQVRTSSVWFYLTKVTELRDRVALTTGFRPAFADEMQLSPKVIDDWTDDCACGEDDATHPTQRFETPFSDDCRQQVSGSATEEDL
jgi:hypothetical protein